MSNYLVFLSPRRWFGWLVLAFASATGEVSHLLLHASAWLLDHEDEMSDCVTCEARR